MRYEIIEGVLYVSPAQLPLHQFSSKRLNRILESLEEAGILTPKGVHGVPKLIVEITSPSNARYDRVTKLNLYAKAGVPQYWLLDPEERTLEILKLDGGHYTVLAALEPGSRFEHPDFANLVLDIDQLFANIPPEIQSPPAP